ncbi:hypothetical protein HELRODRAFT_178484 [Helobdella robusta]|uniref:Uncharacterized protein n=1 Tax=Helobdella robusta TaxID=6412 RepID=T1FD89_HELRO|nr:hypothetical protein HELRODRAFT_178484 [Helobdella robusta]ESN97040.1 hypothetical protein HELRODRAFT_178484 [Helobdella robusta]
MSTNFKTTTEEKIEVLQPSPVNLINRWVLRSALNFVSDGEVVREGGNAIKISSDLYISSLPMSHYIRCKTFCNRIVGAGSRSEIWPGSDSFHLTPENATDDERNSGLKEPVKQHSILSQRSTSCNFLNDLKCNDNNLESVRARDMNTS